MRSTRTPPTSRSAATRRSPVNRRAQGSDTTGSVIHSLPRLTAIAAMATNRVIGNGNAIPWRLPEDFRWFRQQTLGKAVLMGRKTFESVDRRPFPERLNIVLTRRPRRYASEVRQKDPLLRIRIRLNPISRTSSGRMMERTLKLGSGDVVFIRSLHQVLRYAEHHDVMVCGGANVYAQLLPLCSTLFLTRVKQEVAGDAWFPAFEHWFERAEILRDTPEFTIERWRRTGSD
ncbi:MAG: dihydrofolate reductase [Verrucomicrobiales bacterium]|nr:dihydrofolate reductase [Verrucomicrobiales bacterium]